MVFACTLFVVPLLLLGIALILPLVAQPTNYQAISAVESSLTKPEERPIRAAIRVSPATLSPKLRGDAGFEQQLLLDFAHRVNRRLELVEYTSVEAMFEALDRGDVDMVSSGYEASPAFTAAFKKGPSYRNDQLIAVYRVGHHRPRSVNDLVGKRVAVVSDSLQSSELHRLQAELPALNWSELENIDYIDLLSRIEDGDLDVAIVSKTDFQLYRGAFPRLGEGFPLLDAVQHRWIFGNGKHQHALLAQSRAYFVLADTQKQIDVLSERFFSPSSKINQVAANEFARNIRVRLPKYRNVIKEVANTHNLDWRFLAAISYQESNWLPKARSRTGVRGMMMLTRQTASEMGINNRLDVEKSLEGGAAYYLKLRKRISPAVTGPDRDWMALAAYNFGYGHLLDARALTAKRGGDPNLWHDVKQTLPLLHDPKFYRETRYGYARGWEALDYVQQIRHYAEVLVLNDIVSARQAALAENPSTLIEVASVDTDDTEQDLASAF